ncbi:MAG: ATP-binding protein [Erysipelotrichaceae bacterium]
MEKINRPQYLEKLIAYKDKDIVKIVTGIRRCGKSTLLDLFEEHLLSSGVFKKHIIHINLESMKFRNILNFEAFYDYISERIEDGNKTYLIFDELQEVTHWEKAIESFRLDFDVDIYITGSNAYLLSNEFSTLLSGRYVEVKMMPLSFKEFLSFYHFENSITIDEKFQKYLQIGGMPILKQFDFNLSQINETLEGIYSTVILRDILERNNMADQYLLKKIILFLCSNVGCINSSNSIGNVLTHEGDIASENRGKNVAGRTVARYIEMLSNAFIFYTAERYDVKGKQLLKTLNKNYICDIGFRNMLLGYRDTDRGHILENVVYLELIRRGYKVFIGKVGETEIDFVAEKPDEKIYVQVTESLLESSVKERELRPLKAVNDNYEKIVLSMDKSYIKSDEGIKLLNIIDFLLDN